MLLRKPIKEPAILALGLEASDVDELVSHAVGQSTLFVQAVFVPFTSGRARIDLELSARLAI